MGTLTTNLGLTKPTPGDVADRNVWGTTLNGNLDILDAIFKSDGTGTGVGLNIPSGMTLSLGGGIHGNMRWNTDNAYDIGTNGANRPRNIFAAGLISAQGAITGASMQINATSSYSWATRSVLTAPADGKMLATNNAGTTGLLLDFTVDGTLSVRNRGNTADATVTFKTQTAGDNSTNGATTGFVQAAVAAASVLGRTAVADANYTVLSSDKLVAFTTLTASRIVTLPAASAFAAGAPLIIVDESGNASQTVQISVAPNGTDKIAGSNSTQVLINIANGRCKLISNGSNAWYLEACAVAYTASLAADVTMTTIGTVYDGPTCTHDHVGVWRATGGVQLGNCDQGTVFNIKLWDGTTVIHSGELTWPSGQTPTSFSWHGSGMRVAPAGNLRISVVRTNATTAATIKSSTSGFGADSTLTIERIA